MKPLNKYMKCYKSKISNVLKKTERYEFTKTGYDSFGICVSDILKKHYNSNISVINTAFDYHEIIDIKGNIRYNHTDIDCGFYIDGKLKSEYLETHIMEEMKKRNNIFIFLDLENYFMSDFDDDTHDYIHHGVCVYLKPSNKENTYDLYYMNSHGINMIVTKYYEKRISRKRKKKLVFKYSTDMTIMNEYVLFINRWFQDIKEDLTINYDMTKYHNYLGTNLQVGDNYGVCFMFPFMFYTHILERNPNMKDMMEMSYDILKVYDTNFDNKWIEYYFTDPEDIDFYKDDILSLYKISKREYTKLCRVQNYIEHSETIILKKILNVLMGFLTQVYFIKQSKLYIREE